MKTVTFLGLEFNETDIEAWQALLGTPAPDRPFGYIVTPNVDNVVSYHEGLFPRGIYDNAAFRICDSRILTLLAWFQGKRLAVLPGSDLVAAFFNGPHSRRCKIAVFGPQRQDFDTLVRLYPHLDLEFIPAPMGLQRGSEAWNTAIGALLDSPFDLLLCCITFPKQEYICHDLAQAGRRGGLAICAGASVDFLTGRQRRAPHLFQRLYLEWLYRLSTNWRRMWRRYLVQGPKIFGIMLR